MEKQTIRVYFSGSVDKEIPRGLSMDEISKMKEEMCASLTPEEIGTCMTEDDWNVV